MNKADPEPQGYKRLAVYQLSHELAVRVHALSLTLPRFELYEEGSQVRRSSKRISAGIVEGYRLRKYRDEFIRYLYRSLGSSDETREHLEFLLETGSAPAGSGVAELIRLYDSLSRQLARFIAGVERYHAVPFSVTPRKRSSIHHPQSTIPNPQTTKPR